MNQVRFLEVAHEYDGQRLDNFLQRELKGVPKTRLYRALRKGEIRVNKGRCKPDRRLRAGDLVRIPPLRVAAPRQLDGVPARYADLLERGLVYESSGLWVINKPAGLAVHGGSGLNFGLIECLRKLRPEERFLELVHRLDRDTSGCIMVARKAAVLKNLHEQLRRNQVDKRYLALVQGRWSAKRSFVEAPLQKNMLKSGERVVRVDAAGKPARTEFRVLRRFAECTLVEARPVTGRTHQIRVHARHAGHPIMGDEKYCDRDSHREFAEYGLKRLFLHAKSLRFRDEGCREVQAALDPRLEEFLDRIPR